LCHENDQGDTSLPVFDQSTVAMQRLPASIVQAMIVVADTRLIVG